jgi:hypothetical protein
MRKAVTEAGWICQGGPQRGISGTGYLCALEESHQGQAMYPQHCAKTLFAGFSLNDKGPCVYVCGGLWVGIIGVKGRARSPSEPSYSWIPNSRLVIGLLPAAARSESPPYLENPINQTQDRLAARKAQRITGGDRRPHGHGGNFSVTLRDWHEWR